MIRIYILRHEEAVDTKAIGGLDRDRTLTPAGEESAAASARGMVRLGVKPDRIWTSPYLRASQTARIAATELGMTDRVEEFDELTSGANPAEIAGLIERKIEKGSVMIVGHNPDFEALIGWLISARTEAAVNLKKGALALVHANPPMKPGCGTLRWLLIPSHMSQLAQ